EMHDLAAARAGGPGDCDISGEELAAAGQLRAAGSGGAGAIAGRRRQGPAAPGRKLAMGRDHDARLRPRAAPFLARLQDRLSSRLETWHRPGQRAGDRRSPLPGAPDPRPANEWSARPLPLGRGVLAAQSGRLCVAKLVEADRRSCASVADIPLTKIGAQMTQV